MRAALDTVFGMLLLSGAVAGVVFLIAVWNMVDPLGEDAFGIYLFGMFSFGPTILACAGSWVLSFLGPSYRDVKRTAWLTTAHLGWWAAVVGLVSSVNDGLNALVTVALLEPGAYAAAAIFLAVQWLKSRRSFPARPA